MIESSRKVNKQGGEARLEHGSTSPAQARVRHIGPDPIVQASLAVPGRRPLIVADCRRPARVSGCRSNREWKSKGLVRETAAGGGAESLGLRQGREAAVRRRHLPRRAPRTLA